MENHQTVWHECLVGALARRFWRAPPPLRYKAGLVILYEQPGLLRAGERLDYIRGRRC